MGSFYRSKHEFVFVFKVGSAAPSQYDRTRPRRTLSHQCLGLCRRQYPSIEVRQLVEADRLLIVIRFFLFFRPLSPDDSRRHLLMLSRVAPTILPNPRCTWRLASQQDQVATISITRL